MALLEAARQLAGMSADLSFCCSEHFKSVHSPDCPMLVMPKIVAALEAAAAVVEESGTPIIDNGLMFSAFCRFCTASIDPGEHESDCPWQALVAALKGETVTA